MNRRLQLGPLPVVADVQGTAVGAGLEPALSAGLMLVTTEARLRPPEVAAGTSVAQAVVIEPG